MPVRVARLSRNVALAVAVVMGTTCCSAPPDPVVEGYALALDIPQGWNEVTTPDPDASDNITDPVIYAAHPGDTPDKIALGAQVFPEQVSSIEEAVGIAEAGRLARWENYESEPPTEINVNGADDTRRLHYTYTYTCADTGGDCAGTVFVLLRDRDAYLVRVEGRGNAVPTDLLREVRGSLALVE